MFGTVIIRSMSFADGMHSSICFTCSLFSMSLLMELMSRFIVVVKKYITGNI